MGGIYPGGGYFGQYSIGGTVPPDIPPPESVHLIGVSGRNPAQANLVTGRGQRAFGVTGRAARVTDVEGV